MGLEMGWVNDSTKLVTFGAGELTGVVTCAGVDDWGN